MKKGNIKITLRCEETNEEVFIALNGNDRKVDIECFDVSVTEKSELFLQGFIGILATFHLTDKFVEELEK